MLASHAIKAKLFLCQWVDFETHGQPSPGLVSYIQGSTPEPGDVVSILAAQTLTLNLRP